MNFWLWMLLAWLGGNISMALALYLTKRAQDVTFNHVDWD